MPDRESLLDACGRKETPLLLFNSVIRSSQGPGGYPDGEGSVERSDADRAQGLYYLDGTQPKTRRHINAGSRKPV